MAILVFFVLYILLPLLPVLFGMTFALLTMLPPIRRWNQSYAKRILTSLVLGLFAILLFRFLIAYGNTKVLLYFSGIRSGDSVVNVLLQRTGNKVEDVEKELLIRKLLPR